MKKLLSALMTSSLLFVGTSPVYASGYTSAYAKVINNPHGALKNQISYYEKYMEEKINVGRYFTYDLNKDGTPELFLL
jgi:cytoskeletal protein RodZ